MLKDEVIENVKVGDRVVAEFEVTEVDCHSGNVRWGSIFVGTGWVLAEHIIEHKKPPLKIGDTFPSVVCSNLTWDEYWTIISLTENHVWAVDSMSTCPETFEKRTVEYRLRRCPKS
jgi:hypothetical protein